MTGAGDALVGGALASLATSAAFEHAALREAVSLGMRDAERHLTGGSMRANL